MSDTNTIENPTTPPVVADETKSKRGAKVSCETNWEGESLTFTFGDAAKTVRKIGLADMSPEMVRQLALHGLKQKAVDGIGAKETTADMAVGIYDKTTDNLKVGKWNAGKGDGPSEDSIELLARAITNVSAGTKEFETVLAKMKAADKATRAAYRAVEEIGIEIAKLKAAKGTSKVTLTDLLANV